MATRRPSAWICASVVARASDVRLVGQRDVGAGTRGADGNRASDPARRPGDEHDATLERSSTG